MLVAFVMLCNALRPSTSNLTVPSETWSFLMIVIRAHSQFSRPTLPSLVEVDGYCLSSRGLSRNLKLCSEVTSLQWRHATIFAFHVGDMTTFSAWSSEPCEGFAVRREKTVNSCLCYFKILTFEPRAPALQAIFLPTELGLQPFRGLRGFYCRQYLFWSVMNAWIFIPYIFRVCTPKVSRFIKRNSWSEGELLLFMFSEK